MDTRPRLLDAFCGAGGATRGYQLAGFHVTGVDIKPQPRYVGDAFHQGDALDFIREHGHEFDAIHASPPCQAYSALKSWNPQRQGSHPELVEPTRRALAAIGRPFVIENVVGSPLNDSSRLCGSSFGLRVFRHRLFESNVLLLGMSCQHSAIGDPVGVYGDHPEDAMVGKGTRIRRARTLADGRDAMGIDWMTWRELTQAIPPAYTAHIGAQLIRHVAGQREAA